MLTTSLMSLSVAISVANVLILFFPSPLTFDLLEQVVERLLQPETRVSLYWELLLVELVTLGASTVFF